MAQEIPVNREVCPEINLSPTGEPRDLGTEVDDFGFFARHGDAPIGRAIRGLIGVGDIADRTDLDDEIRALYRGFELWLVPHSVSIIRRRGAHEAVYVGMEVRYRVGGRPCSECGRYKNGRRTCSVRGLIPTSKFITYGIMRANIDIGGGVSVVGDDMSGDNDFDDLGLKLRVNAGASLKAQIELNVATPFISAVGLESKSCEWRFDRHEEEPLFGRDLRTYSIVALPRRQSELVYDIRFYIGLRRFLLTRRIESDWVEVRCPLEYKVCPATRQDGA